MIVRTVEEVIGTNRDVCGSGWHSRRLILREDGMGYSLHDTVVKEGTELHLHYKQHLETNYCVSGEGEVLDVATGKTSIIRPGTVYALNNHDKHVLRAVHGDLKLICVFSPPLSGQESHGPDGSYTLEND